MSLAFSFWWQISHGLWLFFRVIVGNLDYFFLWVSSFGFIVFIFYIVTMGAFFVSRNLMYFIR